jgi:general secretion pathway protein N
VSRRLIATTLGVVVLIVVAIVVVAAPANWLALYVARETHGVLLLADAQGTVWSGSAVLAVGSLRDDATPPTDAGSAGATSERLALPGRVNWALEWGGALAPVLHLTHDGVLLQPVAVRHVDHGWSVDAGGAVLPAAMLRLAGAPLNTLMPDGRCELRWNALHVDADGAPLGEGTLRIGGLALALSPVRPLGDYLATWSVDARGLTWQIATERGPLALEGNGAIAGSRSQVRVVARPAADASPAVAAQLGPLLDMIGRHGSAEAVIQMGAS